MSGATIKIPTTPDLPCVLEVNGFEITMQATYGGPMLVVIVRATGPRASVKEVLTMAADKPARAVIEIVDAAWRVVDMAEIERAKLGAGSLIETLAKAGRPVRAADCHLHALAWAALGVAELGGLR